jgi:hypothetical protein
MHKNATKCNETIGKWCKNKHGASKIIDTFETYQALPLIRAKEAVQAALVETRARLEREAATKAAGEAAAVADRAAMPAPNEGPGEPSGVATMAGREGLAEVGLDATQGGTAQDPGEEVSAAGEARAVSSALRSKPQRKCVTQSTLSVRKGRGSKSRN